MRAVLLAVLAVGCWREAPPCDQAGFDAVAETCVRDGLTMAECAERTREHREACARRIEAE